MLKLDNFENGILSLNDGSYWDVNKTKEGVIKYNLKCMLENGEIKKKEYNKILNILKGRD